MVICLFYDMQGLQFHFPHPPLVYVSNLYYLACFSMNKSVLGEIEQHSLLIEHCVSAKRQVLLYDIHNHTTGLHLLVL